VGRAAGECIDLRELSEAALNSLVGDLARAASGIDYIYRLLGRLTEELGAQDAVAVLEDPSLGRQAFRAGRRRVAEATWLGDPLGATTGVHTHPEPLRPEVARSLADLCQVALQLDLHRHDASHDPLTGLFNRRSFDALLEQSAARSARYGWPFALALIDLDSLKAVNDRLGHEEGDRLLRTVGLALRRCLRSGDAAARVGGDEFAVILSNGGAEAARGLLERLRSSVTLSSGQEVGVSAGVVAAPADGTDPADLYRLADARLYQDKRRPTHRSSEPA
jgi:diguanylate cyclase (GGDEF)-like protein